MAWVVDGLLDPAPLLSEPCPPASDLGEGRAVQQFCSCDVIRSRVLAICLCQKQGHINPTFVASCERRCLARANTA